MDFDFVEETMIRNGALSLYRFLLLLGDQNIRESTWGRINEWVMDGGVLLAGKNHRHYRIRSNGNLIPAWSRNPDVPDAAGKGHVLFVPGSPLRLRPFLSAIAKALRNSNGRHPWQGASGVQLEKGSYATELSDGRIVRYDSRTRQLIFVLDRFGHRPPLQ
jgi:hypothetical protein